MLLRRNATKPALLLIEKGADIHSADNSGLTPFQMAVSMNNKKIADLLISRGARKIAPPGTGTAWFDLSGKIDFSGWKISNR